MNQLVIIVGQAGVGKTAVRGPLAERLGVRGVGPDDFPRRWDDVYWQLDAYPCVLECCQIPRAVRKRLTGDHTIVELQAPDDVRRARLEQQGLNEATIGERMEQAGEIAYGEDLEANLVLDATEEPQVLVDRIAAFLDRRVRFARERGRLQAMLNRGRDEAGWPFSPERVASIRVDIAECDRAIEERL